MSLRKAVTHLKRVDPKMAAVIEAVGPCRFVAKAEGTHFEYLTRAIVFQQLSGKAADTIHTRFCALFDDARPVAQHMLAFSDDTFRSVGVSRQKMSYLRDLSERVHAGAIPIDVLHALSDDEILSSLTSVKGIGRWTVQMFLMFRLGRLDVLPDLDLGVQKGLQRAYRMRKLPTPKRVLEVGAKWAPYRSIAAWYLWRFLEV